MRAVSKTEAKLYTLKRVRPNFLRIREEYVFSSIAVLNTLSISAVAGVIKRYVKTVFLLPSSPASSETSNVRNSPAASFIIDDSVSVSAAAVSG